MTTGHPEFLRSKYTKLILVLCGIALAGLAVLSYVTSQEHSDADDSPAPIAGKAWLSELELQRHKKRAMGSNKVSAEAVMNHYLWAKDDVESAIPWIVRAADLGSTIAVHNLEYLIEAGRSPYHQAELARSVTTDVISAWERNRNVQE